MWQKKYKKVKKSVDNVDEIIYTTFCAEAVMTAQ